MTEIIEITPEIKALLQYAVSAIYAACQEYCSGGCDCHDTAQRLNKIFHLGDLMTSTTIEKGEYQPSTGSGGPSIPRLGQ